MISIHSSNLPPVPRNLSTLYLGFILNYICCQFDSDLFCNRSCCGKNWTNCTWSEFPKVRGFVCKVWLLLFPGFRVPRPSGVADLQQLHLWLFLPPMPPSMFFQQTRHQVGRKVCNLLRILYSSLKTTIPDWLPPLKLKCQTSELVKKIFVLTFNMLAWLITDSRLTISHAQIIKSSLTQSFSPMKLIYFHLCQNKMKNKVSHWTSVCGTPVRVSLIAP